MVSRLWLKWLGLGMLSTVTGCAVTPPAMPPAGVAPPYTVAPSSEAPPLPPVAPPADVPPVVTPLPYAHPPSTTGHSRSDISQPPSYEQKMDQEELAYRRRRSAQEQEQEQSYRQWEQERARERDPRWER
jgi:hypothetical protein